MKSDLFSGRAGLVLAALGMAIGTGNLWRFPRVAAQYDGGAFLIPWLVFLFTWSIPILIAEFTLGKATRRGPIGAFAKLAGKGAAWMGAFMAFVTLAIATYYSVVTGWTLAYLADALHAVFPQIPGGFDAIPEATDPASIEASRTASIAHFTALQEGSGSLIPGIRDTVAWHFAAVLFVTLVVWSGVRWGIELASKILIPLLFLLLIGGATWVIISFTGAQDGVRYLFTPDWNKLAEPDIWIAGLSQSAWSTGAGWGLILAYGAATRRDADAVVNTKLAATGNNSASLFAALFLFPAIFGLMGAAGASPEAIKDSLGDSGPASTGAAFTLVPFIFKGAGDSGPWLTIAFYGGLSLAAISSLIALYEMCTRCLIDMGLNRTGAVWLIALIAGGAGVFSALDLAVFTTVDWVAGLGLIFGGLFIAWAVQIYGVDRFRKKLINELGADQKLKGAYNYVLLYAVPLQAIGLLGWWSWYAATDAGYYDPNGVGLSPWDPTALGTYGIGPLAIWGGTLLLLFFTLSPWIGRASLAGDEKGQDWGDERPRLLGRLFLLFFVVPLPLALWWQGDAIRDALGRFGKTAEESWASWDGWWMVFALFTVLTLIGGFIRYLTKVGDGNQGGEETT